MIREWFVWYLKGMAMGIADLVPGVSGGTVALIAGIYQRFMRALASLDAEVFKLLACLRWRDAMARMDWKFLLALFAGIFSSILLFSRLAHYLFTEYTTVTLAAFFGLSVAATVPLLKHIPLSQNPKLGLYALGSFALAYWFVGMERTSVSDSLPVLYFIGIAASAVMLLPGISGSFLLLIMGKYLTIIEAVKNPLDTGNIGILIVFALGCLTGVFCFSRFVSRLYAVAPHTVSALLLGLMAGAIRKLWPWKETLTTEIINGKIYTLTERNILPREFDQYLWLPAISAGCGFLLVMLLYRNSHREH